MKYLPSQNSNFEFKFFLTKPHQAVKLYKAGQLLHSGRPDREFTMSWANSFLKRHTEMKPIKPRLLDKVSPLFIK